MLEHPKNYNFFVDICNNIFVIAESAVQPGHIIQAGWCLLSQAQPSAGDGQEMLGGETHPALLVIGQFGFINIEITNHIRI